MKAALLICALLLGPVSALAQTTDIAQVRAAADKGDARAQYIMGSAYYMGTGVARDVKAAHNWYRLSAEQGFAEGEMAYGIFILNGFDDNAPDRVEAVKWIRKAADQGLTEAQINVAGAYFRGVGVPADGIEACKWATLAAKADGRYGARQQLMRKALKPEYAAECDTRAAAWKPVKN